MSYQAIVTKYIGPTNTRGSRVKATAAAGSLTLAWDDSLNSERNHTRAAQALAEKFGWGGKWYAGVPPTDVGFCFVNADVPAFETRRAP